MGLWGFRTEQKDKLKKHSGAICLIKQRRERERVKQEKQKKMTEKRRERETYLIKEKVCLA